MKKEISNTEKEFIEKQYELQKRICTEDRLEISAIKTVAGVDLAYWKEEDIEYAACCVVVLDFATKQVIEKIDVVDKVDVPYIPGCLAFREVPLFLRAYEKMENDPDVILFDGNGYLHPRHMGLAMHAGILIDKPTIGVAKSYYKVKDVDFVMPDYEENSYCDIEIDGEIYGRVLRTHSGINPIFVSKGNRMDLDKATEIAKRLVTKESRIPLPTRYADIMTHEVRSRFRDVTVLERDDGHIE